MRLGVLISGRGSNLQALIDATCDDAFPATLAVVVSNEAGAGGLKRAQSAGIPTVVVSHRDVKPKAAFEAQLTETFHQYKVDLVCCAGFMRLLSEAFDTDWKDRLINIHPSLLPSFRGLDVHARALSAGVKVSGCTVHYVRVEMDDGPIIGQAAVPVLSGDTPERLATRVLEAEHQLYPACVRAIAEGRTRIQGGRVIVDGEPRPIALSSLG
ncbi:MAG: phosphoribosylglycinamide formyltransferase [Pseudomonadota bacterium]